jgi:hypothetical protein
MSKITFENDDSTQKIIIEITWWPEEDIQFTAHFDPVVWKQDKESWHYIIASGIIWKFQSFADDTAIEVE